MGPDEHIDPEVEPADLVEQRQPADASKAVEDDAVTAEVPVEVPEADLLEQSASVPLDDEDAFRG